MRGAGPVPGGVASVLRQIRGAGEQMITRALVVDDSRTARVRMRRLLEGAEGGHFEVAVLQP